MGFIKSFFFLSLVGEECIGLNTKESIFFLENSLVEFLNSQIRFDFKEAPALFCIGIAFFLHPQFMHFHVFPLSVTCSAVSRWNIIPLSVFIWCADSAAQAERETEETKKRETKGERTVRLTSEKQEFSLSAQRLCRVCCFWRRAQRIHNYTNSYISVHLCTCKEVCVTVFARAVYAIIFKQTRTYMFYCVLRQKSSNLF